MASPVDLAWWSRAAGVWCLSVTDAEGLGQGEIDPPDLAIGDPDAAARVSSSSPGPSGGWRASVEAVQAARAADPGAWAPYLFGDLGAARARDRADVHEDILAAVVRRNEAKTLRFVEPLHHACRHDMSRFRKFVCLVPSLTAAAGVVERNLRPPVPPDAPPAVADMLQRCWAADPAMRPPFTRICEELTAICAALDGAGAAPGGAA
jgi:hypothetical protein